MERREHGQVMLQSSTSSQRDYSGRERAHTTASEAPRTFFPHQEMLLPRHRDPRKRPRRRLLLRGLVSSRRGSSFTTAVRVAIRRSASNGTEELANLFQTRGKCVVSSLEFSVWTRHPSLCSPIKELPEKGSECAANGF